MLTAKLGLGGFIIQIIGGVMEVPKTFSPIAGWFLFAAGWVAIYTGAAVVLNTAFGKVILPTGAPLSKPQPASISKAS